MQNYLYYPKESESMFYIFRMLRAYQKSIERRPLLTNMITAGSLGLAGDLIAQKRVESRESVDWVEGDILF